MNSKTTVSTALGCALSLLLFSTQIEAGGDPVAGQKKSEPCQACHGADGNSSDPQFPRLAGQHADYLAKTLEDYQSGKRQNAIMAGFAAGLSAQDRADLAAFYARQSQGLATVESDD